MSVTDSNIYLLNAFYVLLTAISAGSDEILRNNLLFCVFVLRTGAALLRNRIIVLSC